jgi:hypothetical protein
MTTHKEALTLALEALENATHFIEEYAANKYIFAHHETITAIKEALAQPEQEPVACIRRNKHDEYRLDVTDNFKVTDLPVNVELLLYTAPPQRKPHPDCDSGCMYVYTEGGQRSPKCEERKPLSIPDDVVKAAISFQKNDYQGPLAWARKVFDWVAANGIKE